MSSIIEAASLEKVFEVRRKAGVVRRARTAVRAVDGISFEIAEGEMVGYLGPNGAGKSTTIKMCTGILVPSGGRVRVSGLDPSRQRVALARRIGVVFGQRTQLWWDLPLGDSFDLLRHVYRVEATRHAANLDAFCDLLDLGDLLPVPVRQLSLGQRMRGELAAALLHDPDLLFLDEPTIGLDVVSKAAVREFLARLNRERGMTVLLTTHDLDDIERLCRRVLIIDHGKVIHNGDLAALVERHDGTRTLVVDLVESADPLVVPGATVVRTDGPRQWLSFRSSDTSAAALIAAVAAVADVRDLSLEEPDVEDVIRRIYGGE